MPWLRSVRNVTAKSYCYLSVPVIFCLYYINACDFSIKNLISMKHRFSHTNERTDQLHVHAFLFCFSFPPLDQDVPASIVKDEWPTAPSIIKVLYLYFNFEVLILSCIVFKVSVQPFDTRNECPDLKPWKHLKYALLMRNPFNHNHKEWPDIIFLTLNTPTQ